VFDIHAPGVDGDAINRKIEERARVHADNREAERVASISLSPLISGRRGFDASANCELFDRPVPPPDFKSWKYRFIRGPLKPLARKIYIVLAQIFERMSENKTQAYCNSVFEIVDLRRENADLRKRIEQLEAKFTDKVSAERDALPANEKQESRSSPIEAKSPGVHITGRNRPRPL